MDDPTSAATLSAVEEPVGSSIERNTVLWLTNFSHGVNHFQNEMLAVLYVVIMPELGFSYTQLGAVTAIRSVFGGAIQGLYGFATPFLSRAWVLGIGNIVMGVGTFLTGASNSFGTFLGARAVAAVGGSAQHPVGYSLLAGYFPKARGTILALNSSISNVGGLMAPLAAGGLLLIMGWQQIFFIVAFISVAMGMVYFLYSRKVGSTEDRQASGSSKMLQGKASYLKALRNRNMILTSLVMMVGGAGRGLTVIFLAQHFRNDLGLSTIMVSVAVTAMLAGGVIGPSGVWVDFRSVLPENSDPSIALALNPGHAVARLSRGFPAASPGEPGALRNCDPLPPDPHPGAGGGLASGRRPRRRFQRFFLPGLRLCTFVDYANRLAYGRTWVHCSLLNYSPLLFGRNGSDAVCGRSSASLPGGGIPLSERSFAMNHLSGKPFPAWP